MIQAPLRPNTNPEPEHHPHQRTHFFTATRGGDPSAHTPTRFFEWVPPPPPLWCAPSASGVTETTSQTAPPQPYGTDRPCYADGTTRCASSTETGRSSAPNGNYQEAARAALMHPATSAPDVAHPPTEPSIAPAHKRLPSPPFRVCYDPAAWERQLLTHGLHTKYSDIPPSFQ
jgi:hypothetical protein